MSQELIPIKELIKSNCFIIYNANGAPMYYIVEGENKLSRKQMNELMGILGEKNDEGLITWENSEAPCLFKEDLE